MFVCMCADLESTRSRLVESERKKSELATLAQQRLEEIENLTRCVCVCVELSSSLTRTTEFNLPW